MRLSLIVVSGLMLAACGVDGEPVQPTAQTSLNITQSGVSMGTHVRAGRGPFSINLGLGL